MASGQSGQFAQQPVAGVVQSVQDHAGSLAPQRRHKIATNMHARVRKEKLYRLFICNVKLDFETLYVTYSLYALSLK